MLTIITHLVALIVGAGGGWYGKGKYGAKVGSVITDVKNIPKP